MEYPSLDLMKLMKSVRFARSVSDVCSEVLKGRRLQLSTMVDFEVRMVWVISIPSFFTGHKPRLRGYLDYGKEFGFLK